MHSGQDEYLPILIQLDRNEDFSNMPNINRKNLSREFKWSFVAFLIKFSRFPNAHELYSFHVRYTSLPYWAYRYKVKQEWVQNFLVNLAIISQKPPS